MTHDSNKDPGNCIAKDEEDATPSISVDRMKGGILAPVTRTNPVSSVTNARPATRVSA